MKTEIPTFNPSRLEGLVLKTGSHQPPGSTDNPTCELCAMEAAAYAYGFRHSDDDEHACPIIGAIVRPWNDCADLETRQKIKPLLERIGVSRSTAAVEKKRAYHFVDVLVRSIIPGILDDAEMKEAAGRLRALPKICDATTIRRSREAVAELENFLREQAHSNSHAHSHLLSSKAKLELARALALELARALARARARELARALARALALELELELARALAPLNLEAVNRLYFLPMLAAIETALDITE